jgi:hypothetical protein
MNSRKWTENFGSGMTVTNQNLIQKEIKRKLILGKAYYHSIQNLLSSCLLSTNITIKYTEV